MAAVTFTRKAASSSAPLPPALEKRLVADPSKQSHGVGVPFSRAALAERRSLAERGEEETDPTRKRARIHRPREPRTLLRRDHSPFLRAPPPRRPSNRACPPGSPSSTRCRTRIKRRRVHRERVPAATLVMLALLETGVARTTSIPPSATICLNEDVEFPPATASVGSKAAWKALE